ncbi:trypsin-7-like [Topomyia yanbarensis]|uniref:trypsin-7-like n=1 Tax=Topomyia yanbarensis TaxID=2498891 RepID=UPI00273CE265|nr:trypsin-7-like [Topomyia yanbarensis]
MTIRGGIRFLRLLVFAMISCTVSKEIWRIVNGRNGTIEEMPTIVSIRLLTSHICGGSILTKYWILSAAHCLATIDPRQLSVQVGQTKISDTKSVHDASLYIIHPDYNANYYDNDIAILKLTRPLTFSKSVQPARLPPVCSEVVQHGMRVRVAGWGLVNETYLPEILQILDYYVIPNDECRQFHRHPVYDTQLCAVYPGGGKATCNGDSGGPLVHNGVQVGIVSWGLKNCSDVAPFVFSKVSHFIKFIYMHTDLDRAAIQFSVCSPISRPICERCLERLTRETQAFPPWDRLDNGMNKQDVDSKIPHVI